MPEISIPEVRLPKALREMSRDDIQHAISEVRLPKGLRELGMEDIQRAIGDIQLPAVDLPDKIVIPRVEIDTKAIQQRLPGRRRRRNRLPFLVIGGIALLAAAWFLLTSTSLAPRLRNAVSRMRATPGAEGEGGMGEMGSTRDIDQAYPSAPRAGGTGLPESAGAPGFAADRSQVGVGPGDPELGLGETRTDTLSATDEDEIRPAL
jgi:hypothetical protein